MIGLSGFPIKGSILTNKIDKDRFSLIENKVGNSQFPVGQYVFFTKNGSLWYRFKTINSVWSPEYLYITGGYSSNTKFDLNGYPITAYKDSNHSINIQRYVNGLPVNTVLSFTGNNPTVIINSTNTYIFYIPVPYVNNLYYFQSYDNFTVLRQYNIPISGTLNSMQIELINDGRFLFSFECDNGDDKQVYIGFTKYPGLISLLSTVNFINVEKITVTFDLPAGVNFIIPPPSSGTFDLSASVNLQNNVFNLPASVNFIFNTFDLPASVILGNYTFNFLGTVNFNSSALLSDKEVAPKSGLGIYELLATINFVHYNFNFLATVNFNNNTFDFPAFVNFNYGEYYFPATVDFQNNNYYFPAIVNFINYHFDFPANINFLPPEPINQEFTFVANVLFQYSETTNSSPAPIPPIFQDLLLLNNGEFIFAGQFNNSFYALYSSDIAPDDVICNFSNDGYVWTPASNNTDPPSHYIATVKDFPTDCNFYPVFNSFNNSFAVAWLETSPVGRLNLKYNDASLTSNSNSGNTSINGGAPLPIFNPNTINMQPIYVYPNIVNVNNNVNTQNIDITDLTIYDINGDYFKLDILETIKNGCELTMPYPISSISFSQTFRRGNTLKGFLGTAIQSDNNMIIPISNVAITIYYGSTNMVFQRILTDINGKFSFLIKPGRFTFQILVNTPSITYSQTLL